MSKIAVSFEASARLQRLIGRGLIPNDEMAIVELVKNAYDAGATLVRIFIQPQTTREPSFIRIADDGVGMSENDVKSLFMFAGYSKRPDEVANAARTPTGEKGIGRFAADKLGRTLDVYSTRKSPNGIHLSIDWRAFDDNGRKKFNEVKATYEATEVSSVVRTKKGTVLLIRHLRAEWDAEKTRRLSAWLSDLLDPYAPPEQFSIELEIAGGRQGPIAIGAVPPIGDVAMELRVKGRRLFSSVTEGDGKARVAMKSDDTTADLSLLDGLHARFVHFDKKPRKQATNGLEPGVRVYRDGFRIEPFGSRDADWLGVAEKRAKRAGHAHVVPNRLFGFVEISRVNNPEIQDTTSRQAIIDSRAAQQLVTLLRDGLGALANVLRERTEPRGKENRRQKSAQLEQARLYTLGAVASGLAHELRQPLQTIRSEAHNIAQRLRQLSISDTDIEEAQEAIDRGVVRIDKNISLVSNLSKGEFDDLTEFDLAEVLRNELEVFANLAKPKGVEFQLHLPASQMATTSQSAISSIIANLINNAMQAIDDTGGANIQVSLHKRKSGHLIVVEDDGGGVPDAVMPHLFSKFATQKTGGMGFGLYYCRMLIESLGGEIGHRALKNGAHFWILIPEAHRGANSDS